MELRDNIMDAVREICGEMMTGRFTRRREARWWNETVQQIIKEKKKAYKKWHKSGHDEDKETYKQKKRQMKKEVAKAKQSRWKNGREERASQSRETIYSE